MNILYKNKYYVFLVLLIFDFLTKIGATKTDWTFHESLGIPWQGLLIIVFISLPLYFATKLSGALLLAGTVGNMSWATLYGGVPNPFVIPLNNGLLAFNMADVYIWAAIIPISIFISVKVVDLLNNGIRKKDTEDAELP